MKKLLILILALAMILSLGACTSTPAGNNSTPAASNPTDSKPSEPAPTDPEPTEPEAPVIYNGMTAAQLDAIPGIKADGFDNAMNATWNFGWEGSATLEYNATKVDFDGLASDESLVWRVGVSGENAAVTNAGWGVGLWTSGAEAMAYMYAKVDVPENINQFRIWAVGNKDQHWSGSGAIRAVALYKNEAGEYVKTILLPAEGTFVNNMTTTLHDDGTVRFSNAVWNMPDTLDDCMLIYDPTELLGKEDVIIFIEGVGVGDVLGDEYTEAAEGVAAGAVMPEMVIVKRVMFLAG